MRELRAGRGRYAARSWALALLPLLGGCAVVGYPGGYVPPVPVPGPQGEAPSATAASPGPVVLADPPSASPPALPGRRFLPRNGAESYEVFGQRYSVMESGEGYREIGLASWYGREFAGRPTSSGETFDPAKLTAAHRSLPLATWVEVTNLENGRKVVLRVNDRGPFVDTEQRIIDVSYEAGRLLGLIGSGTAPVEVRALPADAGGSLRPR